MATIGDPICRKCATQESGSPPLPDRCLCGEHHNPLEVEHEVVERKQDAAEYAALEASLAGRDADKERLELFAAVYALDDEIVRSSRKPVEGLPIMNGGMVPEDATEAPDGSPCGS